MHSHVSSPLAPCALHILCQHRQSRVKPRWGWAGGERDKEGPGPHPGHHLVIRRAVVFLLGWMRSGRRREGWNTQGAINWTQWEVLNPSVEWELCHCQVTVEICKHSLDLSSGAFREESKAQENRLAGFHPPLKAGLRCCLRLPALSGALHLWGGFLLLCSLRLETLSLVSHDSASAPVFPSTDLPHGIGQTQQKYPFSKVTLYHDKADVWILIPVVCVTHFL